MFTFPLLCKSRILICVVLLVFPLGWVVGDSFSSFYICGSYWKMCEEIRTEVHKLQSADQSQLHLTSGLGETEYFSIFKGYKNRRTCHANHMYPTKPKIFSPWSFTMFLDPWIRI